MDGYDTTLWLKRNYPEIKVLALLMYDDEAAIIRMLKNGAKGYILKDSEPADLKMAIQCIMDRGFYHSELVSAKLIHTLNNFDAVGPESMSGFLNLTQRELDFLKFAATELTYKEIAEKMSLSPRTIDGYRDDLFQKLEVRSRVGLVLFAIKHGMVKI